MAWAFEVAAWRQWGPLSVLWGAVRGSLWRELREAPTSCPGSANARGFAAEVASTAAVEEAPPWAAQGSPWPGSGSRHAPVQLEQLHGPGPAAPSLGSAGRAPAAAPPARAEIPRRRPPRLVPPPALAPALSSSAVPPRLGSGPPSSGPQLSCQVISVPSPARDLPPARLSSRLEPSLP